MARKLRLAFSVLLVVAFGYQVAQAEDCRMIGCGIGYVFLPTTSNVTNYFLGNHRCALPIGVQSLEGDTLPKVNDIVTVKAKTKVLFSEQEIEAQIDDFQPPFIDPSKGTNACAAEWNEPHEGMTLRAGDKLRVLGYRTFVGHHTTIWPVTPLVPNPKPNTFPQQLIFILVAPK